MDIFLQLKSIFDEAISSYKLQINNIDKEINRRLETIKMVNIIDSNNEVYLSQVKNISSYYPELSRYVLLLQEIETIMSSLKNSYFKEVSKDKIRIVLSKCDISSEEIIGVINDFELCYKLDNYIKSKEADKRIKEIIDSAYQNVFNTLNNCFQDIFTRLVNEIKLRNKPNSNNDILFKQKKELTKYLDKIQNISLKIDDHGIKDELTKDELKFLYSWLKDKVSITYEQEIIKSIINYQVKKKNKTQEEIIEQNRDNVISKMNKIVSLKKNNPFDTIDLSKFSSYEQEIIIYVKNIYIKMCNVCQNRFIFSDFELGNRKESYFQDKLEWGIILADIENNLIPNIYKDKEKVLDIFKYIMDLYSKEEKIERDLANRKEMINAIKLFLNDLYNLLDIDDLYNTTYDYLFDDNVDSSDKRFNDSYEYYDIRYFIRKKVEGFIIELESIMKVLSEEIRDGIIKSEINPEEIRNKYIFIMEEYEKKLMAYKKYQKRQYEFDIELNSDGEKENIVFCLDNISFDDEYGKYDEKRKKELKYTILSLESTQVDDLKSPSRRNKPIREILYRPSTKNKARKGSL